MILCERGDAIAAEAVTHRHRVEGASLIANQTLLRADPQPATRILEECSDVVVRQGAVAAVEDLEPAAVIASETFLRAKPEVAVAGLDDRGHAVLRQAVADGPHVVPVLRE